MTSPNAASPHESPGAGLGPRRVSGAEAAATLWCGSAIGSLVEGVRRERRAAPVSPPSSAMLVDVERALLGATTGPVLLDGTAASRALAGIARRDAGRPAPVAVRWGPAPAGSPPSPGSTSLDASSLDVGALFDGFVAAGDPPTVDGFELVLLEALVERAGLAAATWARGGDALFAAGDDARRACTRPRPRFLRRRFRPASDPLDVDGARRAEVAGLEGAPIHRVSAIRAVLPTQTRDALAGFGPRAVPRTLPRDGDLASTWAATAYLGVEDLGAAARRLVLPFARPEVRTLVEALPGAVRFGRPGSGGALAGWGAGPASDASPSFDEFVDAACRGALAPRLDRAFDVAARSKAFRADAVAETLRRFRAGTHGWSGRRVLTIAFLALFLDRERLALDDA